MAREFKQSSEGASVPKVDAGGKAPGGSTVKTVTTVAKDVKKKRYGRAAGKTVGTAVGTYFGGEVGGKVGNAVGTKVGEAVDKKGAKKRAEEEQKLRESNLPENKEKVAKMDAERAKEDAKGNQETDWKKRMLQAQLAMKAATAGMQGVSMAKTMLMLKMMLQMGSALIQAAAAGFAGFIAGIGQAIVAGVAALVGTIGAAATAVVGGLVAVVVAAAIAIGVVVVGGSNAATRDDSQPDCADDDSFMLSAEGAAGTELENAKKVYAFFKAYGLSDINISGILGNWSSESSIDPTGVETIFTENFTIPAPGTRKYECWQGEYEQIVGQEGVGGAYVRETVSPLEFRLSVPDEYGYGKVGLITYAGDILSRSYFQNYSAKYPGIHYLGIGLGQWTNGRNLQLLKYADMFEEYEWYDLELQLMFAVDPDNGDYISNVNKLAGWRDESSPKDAAMYFCEQWEGITYQPIRGERAEQWYALIGTWQEGVDYDLTAAESLVAAANASGAAGADRTGSRALRNCSGLVAAGNASAAEAILSYAWGPGESYTNDGTPCWRHLFETIVGDEWYRCCDRTVCVAIRWSGTDSDYPVGGTGLQLQYLLTSPRWQKIDWGGDKSKLKPGDVLIRNDSVIDVRRDAANEEAVHHTLMYVGNDLVKARFGEEYNGFSSAGYELVSGSIGTNSPHVQFFTNAATGSSALKTYYVFRNVETYNDRPDWSDLTCVS